MNQTVPQQPEESKQESAQAQGNDPEAAATSKSDGISLYPETWTELEQLLSAEDYTKFKVYVDGLKAGTTSKDTWLVFEEEFTEKERRAKVHSFFKESVKLYETDTIVKGDSRKIQLFLKSSLSNNARRKMKMTERKPRDQTLPQFLKVALHKTNIDTMQAIHYVAKRIRKLPR